MARYIINNFYNPGTTKYNASCLNCANSTSGTVVCNLGSCDGSAGGLYQVYNRPTRYYGCHLSNCTTGCSGGCSDGCKGNCGTSCSSSACGGSCSNSCAPSNCGGGCANSCGSVASQCQSNGCTASCGRGCGGSCSNSATVFYGYGTRANYASYTYYTPYISGYQTYAYVTGYTNYTYLANYKDTSYRYYYQA